MDARKQKAFKSPFGNTYGGLSLVALPNGDRVLKMEDCFGPDYFGPLSDDQVDSFFALCEVKEYKP